MKAPLIKTPSIHQQTLNARMRLRSEINREYNPTAKAKLIARMEQLNALLAKMESK
jgi:hypothetical protein